MSVQSLKNLIQNNKIGIAILALGLVLFVLVVMLAVKKFGGDVPGNQSVITQEEIDTFKSQSTESVERKTQKKPIIKRQKKISENDIAGAWDSRTQEGRALLQLNEGKYKIIIVPSNRGPSRWYSNGTYTLDEGLLTLMPDLSIPAPQSDRFQYRVLTRSKFPVAVAKHKGRLIWQVPGDEYDVYVPTHHPYLNRVKDKIAVWKVLK